MQQAIAGIAGITAFFQPVQDIQIGTRISRTQFQYTLMDTDPAELALWAPRLLRRLRADAGAARTSPPTSRTTASAPTSTSIATPRCGSACRCRRCRTRCTTRSASGRSPPSSARPTSIAWCWRPIRPGRPIPTRCACCACPAPTARRCRCPASPRITRTMAPLVVTHQEQFPSVTLSFDLAPGYSLGDAVQAVAAAEQAIGMPRDDLRQLFRRRRGIPAIARRRAVADPGRAWW